ncbi:uncharacterized protein AB9X84_010207 [Acanthopagrus schlegelii]
MDGLYLFLVVLLGVVSYSHDQVTGSVWEVSVRPGDNITLYCDCKKSSGIYIVWYRNCSHENQPPFVLKITRGQADSFLKMFPRFIFVDNTSSNSFDLLIMNITESDEGIYYCGTEHTKVEGKDHIAPKYDYSYGDITTRIILNLSKTDHCQPSRPSTQDCRECWTLLFSLCPVSAVLSSLISTLVAYHLCRKKAKGPQVEQKPTSRHQTDQVEDVCYAALEIRQPSQRPKKKKRSQSSDFSTYSAIKTSRM